MVSQGPGRHPGRGLALRFLFPFLAFPRVVPQRSALPSVLRMLSRDVAPPSAVSAFCSSEFGPKAAWKTRGEGSGRAGISWLSGGHRISPLSPPPQILFPGVAAWAEWLPSFLRSFLQACKVQPPPGLPSSTRCGTPACPLLVSSHPQLRNLQIGVSLPAAPSPSPVSLHFLSPPSLLLPYPAKGAETPRQAVVDMAPALRCIRAGGGGDVPLQKACWTLVLSQTHPRLLSAVLGQGETR